MYGMVLSKTNPHSEIMQPWWCFLIYSANWVPQSLCLFDISKPRCLDWQMSFSMQNWLLVHFSVCLIYATKSKSKFFRNSTSVFDNFIRLSMLDTSKSVSSTHSVTISRTKSILDLGTAVKSILFGAISSSVDTKKKSATMVFIWIS